MATTPTVRGLRIELDREVDGRWIAEVPDLPGVMAYGETEETARRAVRALAREVLNEREAAFDREVTAPLVAEARERYRAAHALTWRELRPGLLVADLSGGGGRAEAWRLLDGKWAWRVTREGEAGNPEHAMRAAERAAGRT
jgi:predicted RNase H-like HicB family nuclease